MNKLSLLGIELKAGPRGRLTLRGAKHVLTDDLLNEIHNHRSEILQLLESKPLLSVNGYKASAGQKRLWFLDQITPFSPAYNIASALEFVGPLNVIELEKGFLKIIERHDSFRTYFAWENNDVVAQINHQWVTTLPLIDISQYTQSEKSNKFIERCDKIGTYGFDLTACPLWRWELIKFDDNHHTLIICVHHSITDGWSMVVVLSQITKLYNEKESWSVIPSAQYSDYAKWQAGWIITPDGRKQTLYWKERLKTIPFFQLPTDKPRPPIQSDNGDRYMFFLSNQQEAGLRDLKNALNVSLPTLVFCIWSLFLKRISGSCQFFVGAAISNRVAKSFEDVVGFFVNWLPIYIDATGNPSFQLFLERCKTSLYQAYENQDMPFDEIVHLSGDTGDLSRHPLFQSMLVCHVPAKNISFNDITTRLVPFSTKSAKLDLTLFLTDTEGAIPISADSDLCFEIEFNNDLFEKNTISDWANSFQLLINEIITSSSEKIDNYDLVRQSQHNSDVTGKNNEEIPVSIAKRFDQQVKLSKDKLAIKEDNRGYTYKEMDQWSNSIAKLLYDHGISAGNRIALVCSRSASFVAAVLGVLKASCTFVPIDPKYPLERIGFMLADSKAVVALVRKEDTDLTDLLPVNTLKIPDAGTGETCIFDISKNCETNPAYIIYTSGSTGLPKGVICGQKSVLNFLDWLNNHSLINHESRVLFKASVCFDASLREYLSPLLAGGAVIIASDETAYDIEALSSLCKSEKVTTVHSVPTVYERLLKYEGFDASLLKQVYCGGERLSVSLLNLHLEKTAASITNLYGPTEATIDVTAWDCTRKGDFIAVPIGKPISGAIIRILDESKKLVPVGVIGEIYIGGVCLAQGYTDHAYTQERFIDDPYLSGEKLYRTGDLGRIRHDEMIMFEGRNDRQVKLLGVRIEPEEIEKRILQQPGIEHCVVIHETVSEYSILTACVSLTKKDLLPGLTEESIQEYCAKHLPIFMVPAKIVIVPEFPQLSNGKIDTGKLHEISKQQQNSDASIYVMTDTENMVMRAFQKILGHEQLTLTSDFFQNGGHSLSATQLAAFLRVEACCEITLRDIFRYRTIAVISKKIESMPHIYKSEELLDEIEQVDRNPIYTKKQREK